jgi:hypothetical protein
MRRLAAALRACGVLLGCLTLSCASSGAKNWDIGETPRPPVKVAEWPPVATSPGESVTVDTALRSVEGAQIRVRAYLVALSPPCPACSIGTDRGEATKNEGSVGHTARPRGPDLPGCIPCPPAAATFSDQIPTASPGPASAPLRAVGSAEGLQARHVGHMFVLTGTFHPRGQLGPELDVSDVRAIEGP